MVHRRRKEFPDVVLEIAFTSGGVSKLEIYRRFSIPEVWFWRRNKLEIFALASSGAYNRLQKSRVLPGLDIRLIGRCVAFRSWQQARQTFRKAYRKPSDRLVLLKRTLPEKGICRIAWRA